MHMICIVVYNMGNWVIKICLLNKNVYPKFESSLHQFLQTWQNITQSKFFAATDKIF